MTLEDAINQANIILPEHKEEFLRQLEEFPYGIDKWLYSNTITDPKSLYQGDILLDLPTCFIDEDGDTVEGQDVVALISNTCDMQFGRKEVVTVSPIVSFKDLEEYRADDIMESTFVAIRKNEIFNYFYLPPKDEFPESFIDFSKMISINNTYINNIKKESSERCLLSLSRYGFYLFLIKLTYHLARMEKPTI